MCLEHNGREISKAWALNGDLGNHHVSMSGNLRSSIVIQDGYNKSTNFYLSMGDGKILVISFVRRTGIRKHSDT